jgi:hypothetical protein
VLYEGAYWLSNAFTPPNTNIGQVPQTGSFFWAAFGATFSSVATDILFAQDVYANKTVNIGTVGTEAVIALNADSENNNANPYIAINKNSFGSTTSGIFIGYDNGIPKVDIGAGNSSLRWNGDALTIGSMRVSADETDELTNQVIRSGNLLATDQLNNKKAYFENSGLFLINRLGTPQAGVAGYSSFFTADQLELTN